MSSDLLGYGDAVIASGQSLSQTIGARGLLLTVIEMPTSWTAANLTFQGSADPNGTFRNIHDSAGTEVTVTAAADRYIVLNPELFAGFNYIKVRSGTSGTPVNQAAARIIKLYGRDHI